MRKLPIAPLLIVALAAPTASAAPPAPPATFAKPPVLKPRQESDTLDCRMTVRPGVPAPGTTVTIELELSEKLEVPDPMYGRRKPVNEAKVRALLVAAPAEGKKRNRRQPWATARQALRLADAGGYSFTFTAPEGIYGLHLRGETAAGAPVACDAVVPFGVWPIPEPWSHDNPPPAPKKEPTAEPGDREHGRALCQARCRKDVEGAFPAGKTPTFLRSDLGAALDNAALLNRMVSADGPRLTLAERNDLLLYLRGLHRNIGEFFPGAAAVISSEFTINEHGLKRLRESLKRDPGGEEIKARVFIAYQGEPGKNGPRQISYTDRVSRDQLDRKNKLGYLLFLEIPNEKKATELALALDREPIYSIVGISARDASGRADKTLNRQLSTFIGRGRFNDPSSLRRGSSSLRNRLLPVYLRAAELATMAYSEEREFTEFDAEFGDGEAATVEAGDIGFSKNKKRR